MVACAEELGDYDPVRHLPGYVAEMKLMQSPSEKLEQQVADFHSGKTGALQGISPTQAVNAFLKKAATLDTYGIDPHPVKVLHLPPFPRRPSKKKQKKTKKIPVPVPVVFLSTIPIIPTSAA